MTTGTGTQNSNNRGRAKDSSDLKLTCATPDYAVFQLRTILREIFEEGPRLIPMSILRIGAITDAP